MQERLDPQNGFTLNKAAIQVVDLCRADPGVDREWIQRSSINDRARALELLRWMAFGQHRTQSRIPRVLEVLERPAG